MNESKKRRITMKLKTPNPLFEKWLTEWRDKAKKENSKMEFCFGTALQSLKKYPLPLETGKDCKILKGFGEKLCQMIDDKLKAHQFNMINNLNDDTGPPNKKKKLVQGSLSSESKSGCSKEYCPQEGSGAYAILVTLFIESRDPICTESLTKKEIISKAQHLSRTSFTKPDPGTRYTAWSSMKTLIAKTLVIRKSKPPKFSLTNEGFILAKKLFDERKNLESNKNTLYTNQETYIDLSENANLPSLSAYNSCISSETSTDSKSFLSKQETHYEKSNTGNIEVNGYTTSVKSRITAIENNTLSFRNEPTNLEVLREDSTLSSCLINSKTIQKHVSNNSVASSTESLAQEECFQLLPNSFDIILYVDTCETSGNKALIQDDPILAELKQFGVVYEVKKLKIGDYVWICRDRASKKELVLPYVVERKRMDDFGQSIKDGRYYEQKFRLKRCGLQNVIYLIESYGCNQHVGLPAATLYQAATNTAIQDGFCVKFTESIRHTARYLINFTAILIRIFKPKMLVSCLKENISDISLEDNLISLTTFKEFNHSSSKNKPTKVSDLFVKMLIQIKGMSVDRALAIVSKYPTPALLRKAYSEHPGGNGEKLLASIQFGDCNKNIGPVLSKIVHQVFTLDSFN